MGTRTEEIERVIGDWVAANDLDGVLAILERADVPSGKIYDISDIAKDAHYAAREMIREFRLPDGKPVQLDQRRRRESLQTPKAQHTRKHLRAVPDRIDDAALQLARAHPKLYRDRAHARARPPERPDRGGHERIRLT